MTEEAGPSFTEDPTELRLLALRAIHEGDLDRARWLRTRLFEVTCDPRRDGDHDGLESLRTVDRFLIPALEAATVAEPPTEQRTVRPRLTRLRLRRKTAG